LRGSNPCRHVKKYREVKRERYLTADELRRLGKVLADVIRAITQLMMELRHVRRIVLLAVLSKMMSLAEQRGLRTDGQEHHGKEKRVRIQSRRDLAGVIRERVKAAKAILVACCDTASVERAVRSQIVREERIEHLADVNEQLTNKKQKTAVARVERELRRVNAALNNSDLPHFVKGLAPPGLRDFQKKLEALTSGHLPKPKPSGHFQRLAAQHAALTLTGAQRSRNVDPPWENFIDWPLRFTATVTPIYLNIAAPAST
jgi:hypothetical protein